MIERAQIKAEAKAAMRGKKPSVYIVTLVFVAIINVLGALSIRVELGMSVVEYYEMLLAGREPYANTSFFAYILSLAIGVMNLVLSAGFSWYTLRVARGEEAGFGELFDGFGLFFKIWVLNIVVSFFVFLWSLLFVIPGIIAAYRYSMALYVLLDDPDTPVMECIQRSKDMTNGYKAELFILDLSFIGWNLLTIIPFVGLFVRPYTSVTLGKYYNILSGWRPEVQADYTVYKEPWEK